MSADIEYLKKKVEALEALYLAEKERCETLQGSVDNFRNTLNTLTNDLERFAAHFRDVPYIHRGL